MSAATSEGTGRVYGVRRGELARSTWYAQAAATRPDRAPPAKRGPKTALSDEALVAAIRAVHAAARATRWEALEPIRQGVRERFGRIGAKVASGLRLRHDHGTQYMADDFQQELAFLGIASSPSFVRAPEGNGCAERMIRTLKEQLLWVRTFETVEELR